MSQDIDIVMLDPEEEKKLALQEKMRKTKLSEIPWKEYLEVKDYNNNITEMCKICKANQVKEHGKVVINCRGLASVQEQFPPILLENFDDEEKDEMEEVINPYYWAEMNLDIHETNPDKRFFAPRWYQEMIARCTATRKVMRCGRRAGKTYQMALKIAHKAIMNKDYKILIVCPADIQTEEIINTVLEMIRKLDPSKYGGYDQIVEAYTKTPVHTVKFKNGARIRGFTAGAQGAKSVRGQGADLIILDEVDYLNESDVNSITTILMDKQDTEMWTASTPDGKKNLFKMSKNIDYKNFHFPSYVIPHYNDTIDKEFRNNLTDIGYVQEVMAEFGESMAGVFQNFFVSKCLTPGFGEIERQDVLRNRDRYILILGCDWNDDKVGTRIVILAFDKQTTRFFVVSYDKIAREGWSQVDAVDKIKNLNRKYNLDHIYVDEGFGTSQVQFIKKYALEMIESNALPRNHPDRNLIDIKGVTFAEKITIHDQETGGEIRKDVKTYMVENCVRLLEREAYILDEEYDEELIKQMGNYVVLGRAPNGKPNYGSEQESIGDHDLDAWMIAVYGFACEYSEFINSYTGGLSVNVINRSQQGKFEKLEAKDPLNSSDGIDYIVDGGTAHATEGLYGEAAFGTRQKAESMYNNKLSSRRTPMSGRASFGGRSSGRGRTRGLGRGSF